MMAYILLIQFMMINSIELIKALDRITGPLLIKLMTSPKTQINTKTKFKNILVIRPGGMGDAFLLLPVLKKVQQRYRVSIDILCEPRNEPAFQTVDFLGTIYNYKNPIHLLSLFKKKYDAVFDTEQSHFMSAVLTKFIRSDRKIGFQTNGREKIFHHSLPYEENQYEAVMFWQLFSRVTDIPKQFSFNFPYIHNKRLNPHIETDEELICIFPGASNKHKIWSVQKWAGVINWIASQGFSAFLLGSRTERDQCSQIMDQTDHANVRNLCCKLSIAETAQLFFRTKLLVTSDSSLLHLAVICDLPTVSLFGPSNGKKWVPVAKKHRVVRKDMECRPCASFGTIPPCSHDRQCLVQIHKADVINEIQKILK